MNNKLYTIVGPTSSGKTVVALNLCKKLGGVIISADSRQVFKYMDVGTGKINKALKDNVIKEDGCWKIDGINVYGYDLKTPDTYFSAFEFGMFAINKINELVKNTNENIFLVGGTGFYVDTTLGKITLANVIPDTILRANLKELTVEELAQKLSTLNPKVYASIDRNNKVRLIRALERELLPTSSEKLPKLSVSTTKMFGLTASREYLYRRVDNWLESIFENDLIKEIDWLQNNGYENSPMLSGLVYKNAVAYVKGTCSKQEALDKEKFALHAYIRRQQTWFKRDSEIHWIDISEEDASDTLTNLLK